MMKLTSLSLISAAIFAAVPAMAQEVEGPQPGDEKINQLIIYGDDPCPQSKGDEIVVCARLEEADRYRIPKELRSVSNDVRKEAWAQRAKSYEYVAATGIGSCSTAGIGGFTGCGISDINAAYAEKAQDPGLVFGRLIAEARNKRLAGIDAEAEEIEDIVLAEERAAALKKLQEQGNNIEADDNNSGADTDNLPEPE